MKSLFIGLLTLFILTSSACKDKLDPTDPGVLVPLTVMEDSNLPSININGVQLHSETFGNPQDPIILVIHGGPGADYRSQLNFQQLAQDGFYVVFYDQRGSGLSQRLDESGFPSVQIYIDELDGVINHYQNDLNQKVILAGHSWGAMLATAYINQNPTKIHGAILAEPGGFTWEQTEAYISRTQNFKFFDESTNDFVYTDQFITASDHNALDYKFILSTAGDIATGDIAPPSYWRYGWICSRTSIDLAIENPDQMDFTKNLNVYASKVLFAFSELNTAYGIEHAELVSAALPNVELTQIIGCGHEIPEFGWNNFYPEIINYLNEIL